MDVKNMLLMLWICVCMLCRKRFFLMQKTLHCVDWRLWYTNLIRCPKRLFSSCLSLTLLAHSVVFNPQFIGRQFFPEDLLAIAQGGYLLFLLNQPQLESTLQNNKHIGGALVVGVLQVVKAGWLSGLNNLLVNWCLSFFPYVYGLNSLYRRFPWMMACIPWHVCSPRTKLRSCMTKRQSCGEMKMYHSFLDIQPNNVQWFTI